MLHKNASSRQLQSFLSMQMQKKTKKKKKNKQKHGLLQSFLHYIFPSWTCACFVFHWGAIVKKRLSKVGVFKKYKREIGHKERRSIEEVYIDHISGFQRFDKTLIYIKQRRLCDNIMTNSPIRYSAPARQTYSLQHFKCRWLIKIVKSKESLDPAFINL